MKNKSSAKRSEGGAVSTACTATAALTLVGKTKNDNKRLFLLPRSLSHSPRGDVAALLHEGSQGEPERVEDAELVGRLVGGAQLSGALLWFLRVPLVWAEATHLRRGTGVETVLQSLHHPFVHLVRGKPAQSSHDPQRRSTMTSRSTQCTWDLV